MRPERYNYRAQMPQTIIITILWTFKLVIVCPVPNTKHCQVAPKAGSTCAIFVKSPSMSTIARLKLWKARTAAAQRAGALARSGNALGAYRKSSPSILVMQSTQDRTAQNAPRCLGGTRYRRVLVQRKGGARPFIGR